MTINELAEFVHKCQENGYGEDLVIKSSDDEGNDYSAVSSLQKHTAKIYNRNFVIELVADEDVKDYNSDELTNVICIW